MTNDEKMRQVLGERIGSLRTKLGMYQADLADKLGVGRANISKYEKGRVMPPGNVLNSLADILHTSTDYLLGKTDDPQPVKENKKSSGSNEQELVLLEELDKMIKRVLKHEGRILTEEEKERFIKMARALFE